MSMKSIKSSSQAMNFQQAGYFSLALSLRWIFMINEYSKSSFLATITVSSDKNFQFLSLFIQGVPFSNKESS